MAQALREYGCDIPPPLALAVAESTNLSFGIFASKMALSKMPSLHDIVHECQTLLDCLHIPLVS